VKQTSKRISCGAQCKSK